MIPPYWLYGYVVVLLLMVAKRQLMNSLLSHCHLLPKQLATTHR